MGIKAAQSKDTYGSECEVVCGSSELLSSPDNFYLTITCPDISFPCSVISQFMAAPRSTHMEATLRVVRYLKAHLGCGLFYEVHGHLRVEAFTDSDWVGSPLDRRSTTGYCTFLSGNLVT